jgi:hypothetical protein
MVFDITWPSDACLWITASAGLNNYGRGGGRAGFPYLLMF